MSKLMREIKLNEVCDPAALLSYDSTRTTEKAEKVDCTYFNHPQEIQDMLHLLHIAFRTSLYRRHLLETVNKVKGETCLSITDFAQNVWKPVHEALCLLVGGLVNGNVTLKQIDQNLGHLKKESDVLQLLRRDITQVYIFNGF